MRPNKLWGVYHADGGLMGELAYVFGKLRGTAHCALCDITHGSVAKKPEWKRLEAELDIPMELVHLNEQSPELEQVTEGRTPCVVSQTGNEWRLVMGPEALESCNASVDRFRERLADALSESSAA